MRRRLRNRHIGIIVSAMSRLCRNRVVRFVGALHCKRAGEERAGEVGDRKRFTIGARARISGGDSKYCLCVDIFVVSVLFAGECIIHNTSVRHFTFISLLLISTIPCCFKRDDVAAARILPILPLFRTDDGMSKSLAFACTYGFTQMNGGVGWAKGHQSSATPKRPRL